MPTILGDVVWPALFLEDRLLSVWVIVAGLLIEYFFVWRITSLGAVRAIWANLAMNAASTLLGIVLLPFTGLLIALFPGELIGTFNPITWGLTFLLAVFLNTWIEYLVLWKAFKQDLSKRKFWLLALANALSVGFAFVTFLIYPIKE
jgi:hypothetical protein